MKLAQTALLLVLGCSLVASCKAGSPTETPPTQADAGNRISVSDRVASISDTTVVPTAGDTSTARGVLYIGSGGD